METDTKSMEDYSSDILDAVKVGDLDTAHNIILEQCTVHGMNAHMSIMALQRQLIENVQEMTVTLIAMQCELDEKSKKDMM